jgi:cytochrome c-type biogenesis protein
MQVVVADFVQQGLESWWAPALAFAAGVVSFASPCVFPLVPGYLSFVAGAETPDEKRPVVPILLFIGGFAAVFTALGAFTGTVYKVLRSPVGIRLSGLMIITFGVLMLLDALRIGSPGLGAAPAPREGAPGAGLGLPARRRVRGRVDACIGPVLAGVLAIAAAQGVARGAFLLLMYSAGLGPFLLVGLGVHRLMRALSWVKRHYQWIAGVSGFVMVTIGVLVFTNTWTRVLNPVLRAIRSFNPPI